ncbi:MAG: hypothetical protein JSV53_09310 [candidate division WOR-3 bacterium]|nr:MAG: hypothetical protein JSV53_09310 [candidate division WOR-3 bacterium]
MLYNIISFITRDPIRKIFATIFAFGLWIYVAIGNNYSYQREIKVLYLNLPDSFIIVDSVSRINVIFSGRGGALFSIWAAPPKAQCNLSDKDIGQTIISAKDLRIPLGYGPLKIDFQKPTIDVLIDRKVEKAVTVMVPTKGMPKKGYAIDEIEVLDTVYLTGPQEMLQNISELQTESLNVRNRSISFEKDLKLEIPSPMLDATKKSVEVKINIAQSVRKTLTGIPLVLVYAPGQNAKAEKNALDTLIVEGSPGRVRQLSNNDIEVRIKLTKLGTGDYLLPAEIVLPEYVIPVKSVPKKFQLTVY